MLTKKWQCECTSSLTASIFFYTSCCDMVADMVTLWGHPLQSWMTQLLLSLFSLLAASVFTAQISMSVKSPWMCVMAASAPTPRGRTSACVMTVSCHRRIWRPVWVTMRAQSAITEQVCSYSHVALLCVRFSFSVQRPWEDENKAVSSVCFFKPKTFLCCWVKDGLSWVDQQRMSDI